jgi:GcrA cell cycle regulator
MADFHWTNDQVARLRDDFEAGMSGQQMGALYGRTRNSVIGKLNRLGLTRPRIKRTPRPAGAVGLSRAARMVAQRAIELPAAIEPPPEPAGLVGKPLVELADGECRYPLPVEPVMFCSAPALAGSTWCAFHAYHCTRPSRPLPTVPGQAKPAPALTARALRAIL